MKKNFSLLTILILSLNLSACSSPTEREFNKTTELAEQGYANAQIRLAQMYFDGIGTEIDHEQALIWIKKAADQGDSQAFEWFHNQALHGNQEANQFLSDLMDNDNSLFSQWLLLQATKGDVQAQYTVGWMYDLGKGLIEDPYSAMKWYRKAASQGNPLAKEIVNYRNLTGIIKEHHGKENVLYWPMKSYTPLYKNPKYNNAYFYHIDSQEIKTARTWDNSAAYLSHKSTRHITYVAQPNDQLDSSDSSARGINLSY
ncbi:tetratricopeptide repeat protein [Acinetobacter beijerinckii]|uniref:tetratricopeptide repeat protein n=1 Tax=Acinetobacter beijerinckii TaxID=262668 RepID=UPI003AF4F15E